MCMATCSPGSVATPGSVAPLRPRASSFACAATGVALAAVLAFASSPRAAAQTRIIESVAVQGEVLDNRTGLPVAGVFVQFPQLGLGALSDSLGYFSLDAVPAGEQTISTYRLGYATLTAVTPIVEGEVIALYLTQQAIPLPGIAVEVAARGATQVRRQGRDSDFIGPGAIAEMEHRTDRLLEVFRTKAPPRLRIQQQGGIGGISFCVQSNRRRPSVQEIIDLGTGCHPAMIVLDGVPVFTPPATRELAGLAAPTLPADVAALILEQRPAEIRSIRVLTPTDAFFRYGDAGRLGAVEIVTTRGRQRD